RPMIGTTAGVPLALIREIRDSSDVYSVTFSPDGQRILVGEDDGSSIFDATSGALVRKFKDDKDGLYRNSIFSPDGRFVVQSQNHLGGDAGLIFWDAASGALVRSVAAPLISSVAFMPDGKHIMTGSAAGFAALWDASSGAKVREYKKDKGEAWTTKVSPDGKLLLTLGGRWKTLPVRLLDVATGAFIKEFKNEGVVEDIAFSPDGRKFLSGSN